MGVVTGRVGQVRGRGVAARLPKNVPDSGPGRAAGCCRSGDPDGPRRDGGRVAGAAPVAYRYRDGGDEVAILTPTLVASDAGRSHLLRGRGNPQLNQGRHARRPRSRGVRHVAAKGSPATGTPGSRRQRRRLPLPCTHVIAYSHPMKSAALEIFRGNQRALARPSGTHAWQGGHPEAGPTLGPWRATVAAAAPRLRGDIPAARVHSAHRS